MGKGVFLSFGIAGAGSLGMGGLIILKPWQNKPSEIKEKIVASIREKYSTALLDSLKDESIWTKKYDALKNSSPNNPILKEALEKSKEPNKDEEGAKRLLKEGCNTVYFAKIDDSKSFLDFKILCSKTNEDMSKSAGNWITDDTKATGNNKWDSSLTKLNKHAIATDGKLDNVLASLKKEIKSIQTTYPEDTRTKIKEWCASVKVEIFEGENSIRFKNQESFCREGS